MSCVDCVWRFRLPRIWSVVVWAPLFLVSPEKSNRWRARGRFSSKAVQLGSQLINSQCKHLGKPVLSSWRPRNLGKARPTIYAWIQGIRTLVHHCYGMIFLICSLACSRTALTLSQFDDHFFLNSKFLDPSRLFERVADCLRDEFQ